MTGGRFLKICWIILLVIGSFTLGYTLKPKTGPRTMPPFMSMRSMGGRFTMPPARMIPPHSLPRR